MNRLLEEIAEQPDVVLRVTEKFIEHLDDVDSVVKKIKSGNFTNIILTGMGASYYSCYVLWLKLSNLGLPISIWETSELVNFAPNTIRNTTLVIAVSQSGESAEIKKLVELGEKPGFIIGVTNSDGNCLCSNSDLLLDLAANGETSVSTKTYLASLLVLHLLGSRIIGNDLKEEIYKLHSIAELMRVALSNQTEKAEEITEFFNSAKHVTLLGRGYSLASANYGALILEEAAKFPATSLSVPQFRHGPMEIVNKDFYAIILGGSKSIWEINLRLAKDIISFGGKIAVIAPGMLMRPTKTLKQWIIPSVDDDLLPMLEILPLQQLVLSFAKAHAIEAGIFKKSGKVTYVE